jgi:hypothetical protein
MLVLLSLLSLSNLSFCHFNPCGFGSLKCGGSLFPRSMGSCSGATHDRSRGARKVTLLIEFIPLLLHSWIVLDPYIGVLQLFDWMCVSFLAVEGFKVDPSVPQQGSRLPRVAVQ